MTFRPEASYSDFASTAILSAEETQFVLRLRANEDRAYDELVRTHHASIYHVACRMLSDPGEAADVTQDIFVKVFRNIHGFRGESSLKTWIFRIAFSEILNRQRWARRRYRHATISLDDPIPGGPDSKVHLQAPSPDLTPEAALERREQEKAIQEALGKLSREHRSIIVLRDLEGFSYGEITEILGISLGTVKSRLARARSELKKGLMRYLSIQPIGS